MSTAILTLKKQQGFSLVELMLALVLGLVLVLGIIDIFISNKASYRIQEGLARIQENGRMLHRFLTNDIRPAGFQGCTNLNTTTPNNLLSPASTNLAFGTNSVISGHEYSGSAWVPALPSWLTTALESGTSIRPNTDVIIVRKGASDSVNLTSVMTSTSSVVTVPGNRIQIAANDILMISDCQFTDIFRATAVGGGGASDYQIAHAATGNTSDNLSKLYQTDAQVTRLELTAYYIKDSNRTNNAGDPIYSLYRQEEDGEERELIEGVENIQVVYGVDTTSDGNADTYRTADQVESNNEWPNVVSVNIAALVSSIEAVNEMETAYTFNGSTVTNPGDNLSRRQWNVFISLRNR
ncbi:MAG: PilW family protein [Legionellales bacterium]|nr:PilW family protein [Legionellales bacterium]